MTFTNSKTKNYILAYQIPPDTFWEQFGNAAIGVMRDLESRIEKMGGIITLLNKKLKDNHIS